MLLNLDAGEGGKDEASLLPYADLVNIACGGHAGDPAEMEETLLCAAAAGVLAGAHPGYEDREHFGRRSLGLAVGDAVDSIARQIDAIKSIASRKGIALWHVKLHGALYHDADRCAELAAAFVDFLAQRHPGLRLIGPPGGELQRAASTRGVEFLREGFADRAYGADGKLLDRSLPGAVIMDPAVAVSQALDLLDQVDTLCVHGDSPAAIRILPALKEALRGDRRS
ncbi:MAG: LamB/YcsF family protein [Akkermansiaceae bacterium]|jgi:UPF0271 protein|nr:LamB/YcsF family protein [Akkermansiaceae bacterium]